MRQQDVFAIPVQPEGGSPRAPALAAAEMPVRPASQPVPVHSFSLASPVQRPPVEPAPEVGPPAGQTRTAEADPWQDTDPQRRPQPIATIAIAGPSPQAANPPPNTRNLVTGRARG